MKQDSFIVICSRYCKIKNYPISAGPNMYMYFIDETHEAIYNYQFMHTVLIYTIQM